jgi:hypothetical protein
MENENEKTQENEEGISEREAASQKKVVAKDLVQLTHVEVKKQDLSKDTVELVEAMKEKGFDKDESDNLTNDEITILGSFMNKRLFLTRIAIIANQSRIPLGIEPFKKEDLERILDRLIHRELIDFEIVNNERVYFLTEKGKEVVQ